MEKLIESKLKFLTVLEHEGETSYSLSVLQSEIINQKSRYWTSRGPAYSHRYEV
jgi:hypothetical protein